MYIIRHHFQQVQLIAILTLVKVKWRVFLCPAVLSVSGTNYDSLDTVMYIDTLETFQWTVVDVS